MRSLNRRSGLPFFTLVCMAALVAGCSGETEPVAPAEPADTGSAVVDTFELIDTMYSNMGGLDALDSVQVLVLHGGGTRTHVGQIPATGADDIVSRLSEMTETIDLASGRAAFDNIIQNGEDFTQHRTEVLTYHQGELISWSTTEGRPNQATSVDGIFSWATHNTPEMLLTRNAVTMALAAQSTDISRAPGTVEVQDETYWSVESDLNGEGVTLLIDQASGMLGGWQVLDTETMWGDAETTYLVSDYRSVGDLMLPFDLEIIKPDGVYASLQYDTVTVNDSAALDIFDIPEDVLDQADQVVAADGSWVPLEWNPVTGDVTHVVAFSHHSMVVEFPDFVVVVEGAYTEGQSLTLARMIEENLGKPIRYVAPTHPHYDHTGGIRALASLGAGVLVAAGHEDELRMIVESPHSNPPDALADQIAQGGEVGQVEVFAGMTEISDGGQTLELYEVQGIPHVSPKVLAFVPGSGVLFQSDLFFGGPGPDAQALYQAIQELGLEVEQIVGGHGGVLPYSALVEAVGN